MTPTDITAHKPVYRSTDGSIDYRLYYAETQRRRLRITPRRLVTAGCNDEGRQRPVQDRLHRCPSQAVHPGNNAGGVVVASDEVAGRDQDSNIQAQLLKDCIRRRADGSIDYRYYHDLSRHIRAEQHRATRRWLAVMTKGAVTRCKTGFVNVFAFGKGRPARLPALAPTRARRAGR